MGHYNDYRAIVKPKPEFLEKWKEGGCSINEELSWLIKDNYPGVSGIYELEKTPQLDSDTLIEFRGNSKRATIDEFIDVIEELDDFIIMIQLESTEVITAFVKPDTQIKFEDNVFKYDSSTQTFSVINTEYEIVGLDENEITDTLAKPVTLEPITLGGNTWLSTESLKDLRWEAYGSKYFDELLKLYP